MDIDKCRRLKQKLEVESEPLLVSLDEFFDGNDDEGSIGCNLLEHPGIAYFRTVLESLRSREDIEAVYIMISEVDPGGDCWPYSDTVCIFGRADIDEVSELLGPLQPNEVEKRGRFFDSFARQFKGMHASPLVTAWWD